MPSTLRYHEISEQRHRILNPFTEEQLMLLGDICAPTPQTRQIDLCCGKGEMLSRWAAAYGLSGTGVDISPVFLKAAHARAEELKVTDRLTFVEADAAKYPIAPNSADIVSCIGATWIGNGLVGTLKLMQHGLRDRNSLLLVGEPYWIDPPPPEGIAAMADGDPDMFTSLEGTYQRLESTGLELVEMVIGDLQGWDRYAAGQWLTVSDWLRENPDDPDADYMRKTMAEAKRAHMAYDRRYMGWGVFVLRQP